MKANAKIITLVLFVMGSAIAMAEQAPAKAATRIDFNKMIDENNQQRAELQKDLGAKPKAAAAKRENDKQRVSDFVDVEVGWGKSRPVLVDRRFNSVGKPRIVNLGKDDMKVQLISKRSSRGS